MAIGDDALAAGYALTLGTAAANTLDTESNLTRDYIAREKTARTTALALKVDKPSDGGTMARIEPGSAHSVGYYTDSSSTLYFRPVPTTATYDRKVITQQELSAALAAIPAPTPTDISGKANKAGDTFTGDVSVTGAHLFLPASSAATTSWTAAYINSDGRVSRGASSERYKDNIVNLDPASLGNVFPQLREYEMIGGDGTRYVGYIAEELDANPDTQRYVVRINDQVESIEFTSFLMAQNASLNARVVDLTARLEALEAAA